MNATVAAPLPFTSELKEALRSRGLERAGHVEGVFEDHMGNMGELRARLREVVGDGATEAEMDAWMAEFVEFLPLVRGQDRGSPGITVQDVRDEFQ